MTPIYILEGETPTCPQCGKDKWIVKQKLERSSELIRTDGLGDLIVKPFDPTNYQESIAIICVGCGSSFQPQSGVACSTDGRQDTVECYDEVNPESGFPLRFSNNKEF